MALDQKGKGYESDPYTCSTCWGILNLDGCSMVPDDGKLCLCGHDTVNAQCSECEYVGDLISKGENDGHLESVCPYCEHSTYLPIGD